ncbi:MAG TPA: DUF4397 domain-containing protein [Usitatibacter sp.]|jgi:hypothetical protein|nr:DUF4397 domain-containing protein [Usitatibacter sp.]
MKKIWIAAFLAALAVLPGCKGSHNQNSTDMRALNAVPDAEPLDVLIDDDVKASALTLGQTSGFSEFDSGTRDVKVRSSTSQSVLSDKSVDFSSGVFQTLLVYGKRAAIQSQILADDITTIDSGQLRVRVANLASDAGPVDIYLASPVSTAPVIIGGAGFGAVTGSAEIAPGSYPIIVTASGTQDVLFQSSPQTFAAGVYYTIVVVPTQGGKQVNAVLLTQGEGGTGTFLQNPLSRMKAVNDVTDSNTINFKVDEAAALLNVPFAGSSSYVTTNSGTHNVEIEQSNVPGTDIATLSNNFLAARDYTILATGTVGAASLTALLDDNTLPAAGFAKIRFVNGLNGSGNVDVLVNFALQASAIPFAGQSSYYQLAPSTITTGYTITFTTAGGVTVVATLSNIELDLGGVYTAYVVGTPANAQIRLVRDR